MALPFIAGMLNVTISWYSVWDCVNSSFWSLFSPHPGAGIVFRRGWSGFAKVWNRSAWGPGARLRAPVGFRGKGPDGPGSSSIVNAKYCLNSFCFKGVLHPWALFLKTLCIFSKRSSNFGQNILWIWSEMFQGTQKSQFYFTRDHFCEVTVKNVRKSIFSMFWTINQ